MNQDLMEQFLNEFLALQKEIAGWHTNTFPETTFSGQLLKLEEELEEFRQTTTRAESLKELADVFIVCAGLTRWNSHIAQIILIEFILKNQFGFSGEEIIQAIKAKMEINKERTKAGVWKQLPDGRVKHTREV